MLTTLLVIVCLILILTVTWVISCFDLKRRRRTFVREKFGRMPKIREWNDTVRNYYDVVNDGTGIDSVTWNDLSLNDVFQRINSCDCSAGEEILYWRLRRNRMSADERTMFEQQVQAWAEDADGRERSRNCCVISGKALLLIIYPPIWMALKRMCSVINGCTGSFRSCWRHRLLPCRSCLRTCWLSIHGGVRAEPGHLFLDQYEA